MEGLQGRDQGISGEDSRPIVKRDPCAPYSEENRLEVKVPRREGQPHTPGSLDHLVGRVVSMRDPTVLSAPVLVNAARHDHGDAYLQVERVFAPGGVSIHKPSGGVYTLEELGERPTPVEGEA